MKGRIGQVLLLAAGIAILLAIAFARESTQTVSTFSTYDTGPNGYRALYNVLAKEGVRVGRLTGPFDLRDPRTRVIAFMPGNAVYDSGDAKRFTAFEKQGGMLVYFGFPKDGVPKVLRKAKLEVRVLDVRRFTNLALSKHPRDAAIAYDALAGHGPVLFDERLQGYDETRSIWSVLPSSARLSLWIALFAVLIVLVDANVRFAPPIVREPPPDRDSAAYIRSMAALLHRAHARTAVLARLASLAPGNAELQQLASVRDPYDSQLLRAAHLFQERRKERS